MKSPMVTSRKLNAWLYLPTQVEKDWRLIFEVKTFSHSLLSKNLLGATSFVKQADKHFNVYLYEDKRSIQYLVTIKPKKCHSIWWEEVKGKIKEVTVMSHLFCDILAPCCKPPFLLKLSLIIWLNLSQEWIVHTFLTMDIKNLTCACTRTNHLVS